MIWEPVGGAEQIDDTREDDDPGIPGIDHRNNEEKCNLPPSPLAFITLTLLLRQ